MIYLINYDAGNLLSIERALEYLKLNFQTTKIIENIDRKDILLIPGVGSFDHASKNIKKSGLTDLAKMSPKDRPFIIGICLGMQLLMSYGTEGNHSEGLNLIEGGVFSIYNKKPKDLKIPKTLIGWENFKLNREKETQFQWLKNYESKSFYHVHSYMCMPEKSDNIIATYSKDLSFIPNIIGNLENKAIGFQFHPEKSGKIGLNFLQEIINYISEKNEV